MTLTKAHYSHFEEKEIFVFPTLLIDIHLFYIQRLIFEIHTSFLKFKDFIYEILFFEITALFFETQRSFFIC